MGKNSRTFLYWVLLLANICAIVFGVGYAWFEKHGAIWNAYGLLMILVLFGNLTAALTIKKPRAIGYLYLTLSNLGILLIPIVNTYVTLKVTHPTSHSPIPAYILLFLFVMGSIVAALGLRSTNQSIENTVTTSTKKEGFLKKSLRRVLSVVLTLFLLSGLLAGYDILTKTKGNTLEVIMPEYALFFGFIYLGTGFLLSKIHQKSRHSILKGSVSALGVILFVVFAVPFASTPILLDNAQQTYTLTFGSQWKNHSVLKEIPFSIPEYFFGTPPLHYTVKENILFYEGKEGPDAGVKLYFDAYMPPEGAKGLPGTGSTLIRIHGGGWTIGDKGASNYAHENKYFANQGYTVFDIQYGLSNKEKFVKAAPVPQNVIGDFDIDDMERHIGLFTYYLADYHDAYGASLDSVFISGGSAGGQLTLATALSIHSGQYGELFNEQIKIKGIIPFYPACGLSTNLGIGGSEAFVNPVVLISSDSPPCLIYQGTHDGIVDPKIAEEVKMAYEENKNPACAVLSLPFASHGSDFYSASYYNQPFIFYMERFMAKYR